IITNLCMYNNLWTGPLEYFGMDLVASYLRYANIHLFHAIDSTLWFFGTLDIIPLGSFVVKNLKEIRYFVFQQSVYPLWCKHMHVRYPVAYQRQYLVFI